MQIVVIADGFKQNEFRDKGIAEGIQLQLVTSLEEAHENADAYFYLLEEETLETNKASISKLSPIVFVHAVQTTLSELPQNCVRVNAWPGFLLSKALELCTPTALKETAAGVLEKMNWSYQLVPDVVGMITPRTIAMIINEAYYALGEKVSTREEIDTAMKLGTGYPYGPFEWANKIGVKHIHALLKKLSDIDARYQPAPLLNQEIEQ